MVEQQEGAAELQKYNQNLMVPIKLQEHCSLLDFGVDRSCIAYGKVTIEPNGYVCVRDRSNRRLLLIDSNRISDTIRLAVDCESVSVNSERKVMALKTQTLVPDPCRNQSLFNGKSVQIYDLTTRMVMKSYQIKLEDDVIYFDWISSATLGLVTATSVYHWNTDTDTAPRKMFDVHFSLRGCRVVAYKSDDKLKWSVLIGLSTTSHDVCVTGRMQLYSEEKSCSQPIDGHAACFTGIKLGNNPERNNLFGFVNKNSTQKDGTTKLHLIEVGPTSPGNVSFTKKSLDVITPPECRRNDFPVALIDNPKHYIIYIVTAFGYLHIFDIETGNSIYSARITEEEIVATAFCRKNYGFYFIDKTGRVLSTSLDENNIILYVINVMKNEDLAMKMASRDNNLKGSETIFTLRFNKFFGEGRYSDAAKVAAGAPNGVMRNENVIRQFQSVSVGNTVDGNRSLPSPLLQYFGVILDTGHKLNARESVEITKIILNQNKLQLLEKWLREDKIECTEELGDTIKKRDPVIALSVYLRSNVPDKVIKCFLETGQLDKIILYCNKIGYAPDRVNLFREALREIRNPEEVVDFAKALVKENWNGEKIVDDICEITEAFKERNMLRECTAFLLDVLKEDRPEHGGLQTKLIEMNLTSGAAIQVADAILGNRMFSYYDRYHIGQLCEKAGLLERALEHYTDLYDIKRAIVQTNRFNDDWIVEYFSSLSADDALDCLRTMLSINASQNLQTCVKICDKYYRQLTTEKIIELFESFKCHEGLYIFLGSIVNKYGVNDEKVHFKYIQSACNTGRIKEVERICRESEYYNPERVKNYLKEIKLPDQVPLIIVCDRFNYVHDLVFYLYRNNLQKYIEIYVQKVNQSRLPEVIGALLDVDCNEECIRNLIMSMRNGQFSAERLVEEVEKRNRLKLLSMWLETRINEGHTDTATHDAIAKIYVDGTNNPERFLKENRYYDSVTVGKYCEKRDPSLACIAYERGQCDQLFINVCYQNNMFKSAARYLVRRCDPLLWNNVLKSDTLGSGDGNAEIRGDIVKCRRQLIDQVIQTALSETHDPEEISVTVKAFINADLPDELMEVLEKIVLDNTVFSEHKNLQNLLILTAIKCDSTRVMGYVNRLDNYDSKDVATICVSNGLFEEAFNIYKKFNCNTSAAKVLIENLQNFDRAYEFAEFCNEPAVWSLLGKAQLLNNFIKGGIDSFIRANDPSLYVNVVEAASKAEKWNDLVNYLQMANKTTRESYVETELLYAYAKTDRLADLEEYITSPNNADILKIADRCFDEGMYESARILYENVSNYAKLSISLANLKEFQEAVDNARKANCIKTWKNVCFQCLINKEYRLAQICGLNIVVDTDELHSLIDYYETNGYVNELLELLETALGLERAHVGIFTELSVLYAKYKPDKMIEHVQLFWCRLNIPKVLKAAEQFHLWPVVVFLYDKFEDYDNAASNIMEHPTETWKENQFKDIITKVSNAELYYRAIQFYIEYKPLAVSDLMVVLSTRIDHSRAINIFSENNLIHLIKPYLISVQGSNNKHINRVLNDIYIDEEDYRNLKSSIDLYDNTDGIQLAQKLERHDLIEFRRLSAYLYKNNNRWNKSVEICKRERLYKDAMKYAAESKSSEIAVDLLGWFLENDLSEHFSACLFQCYDLLRPDIVLELAWKHNIIDFAMPYVIQTLNEYVNKIDKINALITTLIGERTSETRNQQSLSIEMTKSNELNDNEKRQLTITHHTPTIGAVTSRYGRQVPQSVIKSEQLMKKIL